MPGLAKEPNVSRSIIDDIPKCPPPEGAGHACWGKAVVVTVHAEAITWTVVRPPYPPPLGIWPQLPNVKRPQSSWISNSGRLFANWQSPPGGGLALLGCDRACVMKREGVHLTKMSRQLTWLKGWWPQSISTARGSLWSTSCLSISAGRDKALVCWDIPPDNIATVLQCNTPTVPLCNDVSPCRPSSSSRNAADRAHMLSALWELDITGCTLSSSCARLSCQVGYLSGAESTTPSLQWPWERFQTSRYIKVRWWQGSTGLVVVLSADVMLSQKKEAAKQLLPSSSWLCHAHIHDVCEECITIMPFPSSCLH